MNRSRRPGPRAWGVPAVQVRVSREVASEPVSGRLCVLFGAADGPEPRFALGQAESQTPVVGFDTDRLAPGVALAPSGASTEFPAGSFARLPAGRYRAQAVLHTNRDLNLRNAPGDLFSKPVVVTVDPARAAEPIVLDLDQQVPAESVPRETEWIKPLKLRSDVLSRFHGRDIFLRAGVLVPRGFADHPERRYPLRVHVGGYGSRWSAGLGRMERGGTFQRFWQGADAPRFLVLFVDGAGPLGDPYQVDSANHGPYGTALTTELVPHVERQFRGNGQRVVDGGSTGGWVSFALQVFYPDFFQGCWSSCPDPLDFRSFQRINIYEDANAYVDAAGKEVPSCRDPRTGSVRFTVRQECGMENVVGLGSSWSMSGEQWGAWNATFGPRGADGRPVPLWDPVTGKIDTSIRDHWRRYDMRLHLEANWAALAPRLAGKLRVWVGEADDYFLNEAVHRFDARVRTLRPAFDGTIQYGPGRGHCWSTQDEVAMMQDMARALGGPA